MITCSLSHNSLTTGPSVLKYSSGNGPGSSDEDKWALVLETERKMCDYSPIESSLTGKWVWLATIYYIVSLGTTHFAYKKVAPVPGSIVVFFTA